VGDNLTYQPTEPGEDVYKGMSGGAVLNEAGQLVGIHVGLTKVGGDGEGVLISTFLQMVPPEVEEVLGSSTPDVLSSSSSDNEEVKLRRQLKEERRKREEAEGRVEKLEAELEGQKQLQEAEGRKQEGVIKKWFCLRSNWWFGLVWVWGFVLLVSYMVWFFWLNKERSEDLFFRESRLWSGLWLGGLVWLVCGMLWGG
jgi:hypothetical protein